MNEITHPDKISQARRQGQEEAISAMAKNNELQVGKEQAYQAGQEVGAEKVMVGLGNIQQPANSQPSKEASELAVALDNQSVSEEQVLQAKANGELDPVVADDALAMVAGPKNRAVEDEVKKIVQALESGQAQPEQIMQAAQEGNKAAQIVVEKQQAQGGAGQGRQLNREQATALGIQ